MYQPARPTQTKFLAKLMVLAGYATPEEAREYRWQLNFAATRHEPGASRAAVLERIDHILDQLEHHATRPGQVSQKSG